MEIPDYSEEDSPGVPAMLTANQLYLAQLVVFGFNDKAIARRMGITAGTVKEYLVRLRTTLHLPVDTAMNLRAVVSGLQGCDRCCRSYAQECLEEVAMKVLVIALLSLCVASGMVFTAPTSNATISGIYTFGVDTSPLRSAASLEYRIGSLSLGVA